jgi:hypothetical protein
MPGRQDPHPGSQLGRHVHDVLAAGDQLLGERSADAVRALHRPPPAIPPSGPLAQGLVALQGGREALLAAQLAVLVEHGGGVGGLVRVDPDRHRHWAPFLESQQDHRRGQTDLGRVQSSVEPLPVGCRQDRTTILEPTRRRQWF